MADKPVKNYPTYLPDQIHDKLVRYYQEALRVFNAAGNLREHFVELDMLYYRETDKTQEHTDAKRANVRGAASRIQNVVVPIVLPVVESAVQYQTSVFLTGVPLFGVVAGPQHVEAARQLETLIDSQATRGGWVEEFMQHFRCGAKYNLAALDVSWAQENTNIIVPSEQGFGTRLQKQIWQGNSVKNIDPYNMFFDVSVKPTQVAKQGEYAGHHDIMSRYRLKRLLSDLGETKQRATQALESTISSSVVAASNLQGYYVPEVNPKALYSASKASTAGMNWGAWMDLESDQVLNMIEGLYQVTTLYARLIPADFGFTKVPAPKTPTMFKLIIVNHSVIIYFEALEYAHDCLPMLISQPDVDNLGIQTKSIAANAESSQSTASALWNAAMDSRRRAIGDRIFYDANRISPAHINTANPTARIPVRPSNNRSIADAVHVVPYRDEAAGVGLQEAAQLVQFAYNVTGQNPAKQGQFTKGNRTRAEYQDVMGNANGRDQMRAICYEAQLFSPLKTMLKSNVLQYQGGEVIISRKTKSPVEIDPAKMRDAVMEFKVSDGLTPSEKLGNADVTKVAMQVIGSSPEIAAGYEIAPLFSYLMEISGATELHNFEKPRELVMYQQAVSQWQQVAVEFAKSGQQPPPQPVPADFGMNPDGTPMSPQQVAAQQEARNKAMAAQGQQVPPAQT